jgi:hypothetical protein
VICPLFHFLVTNYRAVHTQKSFKVSNPNLILEVGGWGLSNLKTGCCSIKRQAKLQYDETSKNNIKERKKIN